MARAARCTSVRLAQLGTGPQIGVAPANEYTFLVMVMPVGPYYKGGLKPVRALVVDEYDRAAPHGTGDIKIGGNYAANLYAHEEAKRAGYPVELYLDAKTRTFIEKVATSILSASPRTAHTLRPIRIRCCPVSPTTRSSRLRLIWA